MRFDVLESPPAQLGSSSRVVIGLSPYEPVPEKFLREGVRVEIAENLRRDRPLIKTTEFILRRQPYPLAVQNRYEHLLVDDGNRILECTQRQLLRRRGRRDPHQRTRRARGHHAQDLHAALRELKILVSEEPLSVDDVGRLDEAFLTSSTRGLVPIVNVAGTRVGSGSPGPVAHRLLEAYEAFAEREARPAV